MSARRREARAGRPPPVSKWLVVEPRAGAGPGRGPRRPSTSGWSSNHGMIGRVSVPVQALIDEGRAALRAGDAVGARRAFEQAAGDSPSGDVLEGLARVAY